MLIKFLLVTKCIYTYSVNHFKNEGYYPFGAFFVGILLFDLIELQCSEGEISQSTVVSTSIHLIVGTTALVLPQADESTLAPVILRIDAVLSEFPRPVVGEVNVVREILLVCSVHNVIILHWTRTDNKSDSHAAA